MLMRARRLGTRDSKVHYFSPEDDRKSKQIFVIQHESRGRQRMSATSVTSGPLQPSEGHNGPSATSSNPSFFLFPTLSLSRAPLQSPYSETTYCTM